MRHLSKRIIATVLALLLLLPTTAWGSSPAAMNDDTEVVPVYNWDFESENIVTGTEQENYIVSNGSTTGEPSYAELKGTATIENDSERGNVLSLKGGANGSSYLTLPDDLYGEVIDELTFAVWANIDQDANSYMRLLSSTISEKGLTNAGVNGWWQDPEFIVVAGGGNFNNRFFIGTDSNAVASYKGDVVWDTNPTRGKWQHIAITLKNDGAYDVYLDGKSIDVSGLSVDNNSSSGATMTTVLENFFARGYLDALAFNDFGKSLYTSDQDSRGKFDDIRIYNTKLTADQVSALYEETKHEESNLVKPAKISVDLADRSLGEVFHGSAGALYAISEPNVPDINTLIPIKPSHISQKPPNGIQHPTGDALRVSDYFFEAGGEAVNIVMQDYYQHWYYPSRTAEEYIDEAIIPITEEVKEYKVKWAAENPGQNPDEKFIYIPFNEPEQNNTRYPQLLANNSTGQSSRAVFNSDWLAVTKKIKEIDPGAVISGVNLTQYGAKVFEDFIPFCIDNDCLPEIISWHMLWDKAFDAAASSVATYRSVEANNRQKYVDEYPDREVPFPIKVDINEYAATSEIAVGGSLVHYIARYDELKMNSMLPYWNTANSYGSLLAGQNEPNGAWWLYKWYADMMGGDMAKISVIDKRNEKDLFGPGLYGLSSIQDDKKQVNIAFGGTQGDSKIVFNNVSGNANSPAFLAEAEEVRITVWQAGYTGLTGFLVEPTQIIDRNYSVENGAVTLDVNIDDYTSAYFAVITPAVNSDSNEVWFSRFEAENAEVQMNVSTTDHYPRKSTGRSASNGQYIGGINKSNSLVQWTNITVPADGNYRLDMIGGSGATASMRNQSNTGNTNQRINSEWFIKIDDKPSLKVVLRADYSMELLGGNTIFVDLEEGTHSISISKFDLDTGEEGQGESTLDAIELTYNGVLGGLPNYRVQAEFADYDTANGLSRGSSSEDFEGTGYVTGYGSNPEANTRFVVSVLNDGMYDVKIRYMSSDDGAIIVNHDRKHVIDAPVEDTNDEWQEAKLRMFLRLGINLIDVQSNTALSLDYVNAAFVDQTSLFSIEAEDATIVGTPYAAELPLVRDDSFAKYASGGNYVNGITSYDGAERYLEIKDISVPKDGIYKLVVTYSNGESTGTHSYNNDIVERYAQISINNAQPQTVHFKNTISWQQFTTQTIDVELKKGDNTIRFSNNGTYNGGSNVYGGIGANGIFNEYTSVPIQYTPAFDRFDIYPQKPYDGSGDGDGDGSGDGDGDGSGDGNGDGSGDGDGDGSGDGNGDGSGDGNGDGSGNGNGGGGAGNVIPPNEETASGVVEPIVNGSGAALIVLTGNDDTVRLSAGSTQWDKVKQLIVSRNGVQVDITAAIIEQLRSLVDDQGMKDAEIVVGLQPWSADAVEQWVNNAEKKSGASITTAGSFVNISLSLLLADGSTRSLDNWSDEVVLTWTNEALISTSKFAIYRLNEDGTMVYIEQQRNELGQIIISADQAGSYIAIAYSKQFDDVASTSWVSEVINELVMRQIINGVDDNHFAPNAAITRAEFAALLVRALGLESKTGASFEDVNPNQWYASAISTAYQAGIITGKGNGLFAPNTEISREEIAVMTMRAYEVLYGKVEGSQGDKDFADQAAISTWAQDAIGSAVEFGLVQGRGNNIFAPKHNATRAEGAQLIYRLLAL